MAFTTHDRQAAGSGWFVSWFDSTYYHKLYGYRDDREAAGFVDALLSRLRPAKGSSALDLGCGAGRHSRYLAAKGLKVMGIDLAGASIKDAKRSERPNLHFRRHDMRLPFGRNAMDYVFNFFTSFGYFKHARENELVVRNVANALKPNGVLMMDYLNVSYAEAHTNPEETRTIDGTSYNLTRWSDARHFFKRIVIKDPRSSEPREYLERVAKFNIQDFGRMFGAHGLSIDAVYGDYGLNPYEPDTSPRMILIARK